MFKRGFAPLDKVMENKGRKMANCKTCVYFGPDEDDKDDCTNTNVTKFDFVREEDGREYCTYWTTKRRE